MTDREHESLIRTSKEYAKCSHCGLPLTYVDAVRHTVHGKAHNLGRCIDLLRAEVERLRGNKPTAHETVSAPAAERVPLRYGKPFTGIHRGISRGGFHCTDNDCSCHLYQYPRAELKANACQCDPNPSIGGSPPCPVHDVRSEG